MEHLSAPCEQFAVAQIFGEKGDRKTMDPTAKKALEEAHHFFLLAEESGMSGFHFYNSWGAILDSLGKHELAIKKFAHALEFYGDHGWALLNWGWVLSRNKKYEDAEKKFREAINWNPIRSALKGYTNALFLQEKYQDFVDEYEFYTKKYGNFLDSEGPNSTAGYFQAGYSYCSVGKVEEAKQLLQKIPYTWESRLNIVTLKGCIKQRERHKIIQ